MNTSISASRALIAFLGLVLLLAASCASAGPQPLRIGYYARGAFGEAAEKDTTVALSLWGREITRGSSTEIDPVCLPFPDAGSLIAATVAGKVDLLILDTFNYLTSKKGPTLTPSFTPVVGGTVPTTFVVLVRRKDEIRTMAQLRERKLDIGTRGVQVMPKIWLDTVLVQNGLARSASFFSGMPTAKNAATAILNVFFGKSSACVVPQRAFTNAAELNPQIGRQLAVLKSSPAYTEEFVFFSPHYPRSRATEIRRLALSIHGTPRGRQILGLFGVDKMAAYQESQLQTARELVRTYRSLPSGSR